METSVWQAYQAQGLLVYAVNTQSATGTGETDATIQGFVAQTGITFPVLLDGSVNSYDEWAKSAQVSPYPLDVLLGKDGKVTFVTHEFELTKLQEEIEKIL
jgi:uncharacterized YccA/Bax inhibitor family protein